MMRPPPVRGHGPAVASRLRGTDGRGRGRGQVNFVPIGTLRDLVTYPKSVEEVRRLGRSDTEVLECLR
jgi:hypothetical protein